MLSCGASMPMCMQRAKSYFDTRAKRHIMRGFGTNTHLPLLLLRWARAVDYHFHALYRNARRYRYVIFNHPVRPGILSTCNVALLSIRYERMRSRSVFTGEQDFSFFVCNNLNRRGMTACSIQRQGHFVLDIEATHLHHMVRHC